MFKYFKERRKRKAKYLATHIEAQDLLWYDWINDAEKAFNESGDPFKGDLRDRFNFLWNSSYPIINNELTYKTNLLIIYNKTTSPTRKNEIENELGITKDKIEEKNNK